jgi:hypothetical protein
MMHGKKTKMAAGGGMMTKMEAGGGVKDKMPMKTDPTTGKEKPAFLKAGGMAKMAAGGGMMSKMKAGGGIKSKKAPSKMGAMLRPAPKRDGVAKKGLTKGKMVGMRGR